MGSRRHDRILQPLCVSQLRAQSHFLILATGLWFVISRDEQPAEIAVRSPIVFQHVPANLEVSSESVPEALIRVRGTERAIRALKNNEIQAEIDLTGNQ